jgi:hypothetical protein
MTRGIIARWLKIGLIVGAGAGTLFGLAVVCFADCEGPHCTKERIVGVLAHAGLGGAGGLALGLVGGTVRRLFG